MTATQSRETEPNRESQAKREAEQAREILESARDAEWRKPSFGKQLFLGRLRMDLISPWPTPDPEKARRAAEFLPKLEAFLAEKVDNAQIEREAFIPDEVFTGLAELGAFGMKIDPEYGGLGLSNLHYCKALMLAGSEEAASGVPARTAASTRSGMARYAATWCAYGFSWRDSSRGRAASTRPWPRSSRPSAQCAQVCPAGTVPGAAAAIAFATAARQRSSSPATAASTASMADSWLIQSG